MANVLYILQDGITDPLGRGQVLAYLRELTEKGHRFTILSCEKQASLANAGTAVEKELADLNIAWEYIPYRSKPALLSTMWNLLELRSKARHLHRIASFDIVHCRSYIPSMVGLYLKNRFGLRFVFDMRGLWADERVDGGLWNLGNPVYRVIYKFFKKKEQQFLNQADAIVSLTEAGKDWISHNSTTKAPVTVIPTCVDERRLRTASDRMDGKRAMGIAPERFVLSYLGSLGTWYCLPEMLRLFRTFKNRVPKSLFLILTAEPEAGVLEEARKAGLEPGDLVVKKVRYEDVPATLSVSDASLCLIKPVFSKLASSPVKLGELMSLGIPVVCNAGIGDIEQSLKGLKGAHVLPSLQAEDLDKAAAWLGSVERQPAQELMQRAKELFALQRGVEQYDAIYHRTMKVHG